MSIELFAALAAFGLMTGMLSGLLGVGGGIFMVPFLVLAADLTQHEAQATSLAVVLPTALMGSWTLHRKGVADLRRGLAIGAIGAVGALAGVALALALSGGTLRILFAILLGGVGARLIRDAARMPAQS